MNTIAERAVASGTAVAVAVTLIYHMPEPGEFPIVIPQFQGHLPHIEVSISAEPVFEIATTQVLPGPNFRIEVDPALLSVNGLAPSLIVT